MKSRRPRSSVASSRSAVKSVTGQTTSRWGSSPSIHFTFGRCSVNTKKESGSIVANAEAPASERR